MGFNTVHGGVLTTFAGLREYGLIDRPAGKVALTALTVRILHPTSDAQGLEAIQEAALLPKIFQTLLHDFGDCSQPVIESHLVQQGFTPDRAKIVAKVFIANKAFAKLGASGNVNVSEQEPQDEPLPKATGATESQPHVPTGGKPAAEGSKPFVLVDPLAERHPTKKMLAQYTIPLGQNEATLVFTGEKLTTDDFDALTEYVELFKKQFERAQAGVAAAKAAFAAPPIKEVPPSREVQDSFIAQTGSPYKVGDEN